MSIYSMCYEYIYCVQGIGRQKELLSLCLHSASRLSISDGRKSGEKQKGV